MNKKMAFYTSRIVAKFDEENIQHSARSLPSSITCGNSCFDLSSRIYDTARIQDYGRINTAACSVENNSPLTGLSTFDDLSLEAQCDIVPPLDINSEDNNSTTRHDTFSYRKHYESVKIVLKTDKAYETWLSAKRKILSDEATRRKKEKEMKQKEIEERKRLAKEKYELWVKKKSQTSTSLQSFTNQCAKTETCGDIRMRYKFTAEEAMMRLKKWERAKRLEEEHRRMLKCQEKQRQHELEEQRRQMSDEAWNNWIANAKKKPKPVPLNRGMFTLRGTVSDIFVNPNEWKPIIPTNNDDIE